MEKEKSENTKYKNFKWWCKLIHKSLKFSPLPEGEEHNRGKQEAKWQDIVSKMKSSLNKLFRKPVKI